MSSDAAHRDVQTPARWSQSAPPGAASAKHVVIPREYIGCGGVPCHETFALAELALVAEGAIDPGDRPEVERLLGKSGSAVWQRLGCAETMPFDEQVEVGWTVHGRWQSTCRGLTFRLYDAVTDRLDALILALSTPRA